MDVHYVKPEHGGGYVRRQDQTFTWHRPDGSLETYESARLLLAALHGGRDPKISFDRYFATGRWSRPRRPDPIITFFGPRGIDLDRRYNEVRKLLYATYGATIQREGFDFEEILQCVYQGLLVRNRGRCPWNPRVGSFGHYVVMVSGCVFANYRKKARRNARREQIGVRSYADKQAVFVDAAVAAQEETDAQAFQLSEVVETMEDLADYILTNEPKKRPLVDLSLTVLPLLYQGLSRGEIAEALDLKVSQVGRALGYLRDNAREWAIIKGHRAAPEEASANTSLM